MRLYLLYYFLLMSCYLAAQPTSDEQLANYYFQSGEYDKAILYYEKLFEIKKNSIYYDHLFKSYLEVKNFEKAKDLAKSKVSKKQASIYDIDLAYVYEKQENHKKAKEQHQKVIETLPEDASQIIQISNYFLKYQKLDWAFQVLTRGRKLLRGQYPFNVEIAELYELMGKYPEMIQEYLDLLQVNEAYLSSVQTSLSNQRGFEKGSSKNTLLKQELIRYTQKYTDLKIYHELLIWLYGQERNFSMALTQAKSLDKRFKEPGDRVLSIAEQAYSNEQYDVAIEAYSYVMEKKEDSPYYSDAKTGILSARKDKVLKAAHFTQTDLDLLDQDYNSTLKILKNGSSYVDIVRDYAYLKAVYLNQVDSAVEMLHTEIQRKSGDSKKIAQCKLDLGDYLLLKNEVWDASLYYSQVEKDYKYDELGEQAKYKNAKISFYTGDFLWAKAQLDVLKGSTSKLIANDALWLSVLITDNTIIDTNQIPLKMFAKADLYLVQNQLGVSRSILDSILLIYPDHSIKDDAWFLLHKISLKEYQYEAAVSYLEKIVSTYPSEILADDALFVMAGIYEYSLKDANQAMSLYQKLLENYPGSLWVIEARKRYRFLRGDNIHE